MSFRMGFLGVLAIVALVLLTTTAFAEPVADNTPLFLVLARKSFWVSEPFTQKSK